MAKAAFRHRKPAVAVQDKKPFPGISELSNRACPTNGSDRGSLCDHDPTLLVGTYLVLD